MLDDDAWECLRGILSTIDALKRPHAQSGDVFGALHLLLFGELRASVFSY